MCGIAGWFGRVPFEDRDAGAMAHCLRHRGPDAEGIRSWEAATLIHRRLSIIDLTPTGEQPLGNEDGTVWTVYNGEIYNHHPLRDGLEARGHRFRGRSDSEILPHLYEEDPTAFLPQLRGMFAFAIHDTARRRLLLARDRFGIKPMFYAVFAEGIAFASELRALRSLPGVDTTIDEQALYDFTALTYVPAPATFFKGIRALEPGCYLEAEGSGEQFRIRLGRYHAWTIRPRADLTMEAAAGEAERLVDRAVRSQLESDVPLGSLLSGGIDSSLVSAAAQDALRPAKLHTFNVRFPDAVYDETWAARAVADAIGSQHETLEFDAGAGTWETVTGLLLHAGQPFADTSIFAVSAVSRLMRQRVTVALSGDGGDEAFGGYDLYWQLERLARLRKLPSAVLNAGSLALRAASVVDRKYTRWSRRLRELTHDDDTLLVSSLFRWVGDEDLHALLPDVQALPIRRLFEKAWTHDLPRHADAVERLSAHATEVNARLVLPNDFLFKVDVGSMSESLEIRVPMLDEDLFELGLSLPHRLKVRNHEGKAVLRTLARRKLPPAVANKPKWGFGVPMDVWLGPEFRVRLRETLLSQSSPLRGLYNPAAYTPLVEDFCAGRETPGVARQGAYQRITQLLAVHLTVDDVRAQQPALRSPRVAGRGVG